MSCDDKTGCSFISSICPIGASLFRNTVFDPTGCSSNRNALLRLANAATPVPMPWKAGDPGLAGKNQDDKE